MGRYLREHKTLETPQSEALEGQIPNSAGGHAWAVDDWKRLERFLILGSEGGTYYIKEQKLTKDNAKLVEKLIKLDGKRVVDTIVAISDEGRAPKNDPALFALAMCSKLGNEETRAYANRMLPKVARIGTHLLHYAEFIQQFGGWGHGTVRSFQRWFTERTPDDVAYQAVKYANRDGWTQADLLRRAHPKSLAHNGVFKYIVDGAEGLDLESLPNIIKGTELIKAQTSPTIAANLITEFKLPREVVPTELLNDVKIWDALLNSGMGLTAIIRNLGKMSSVGLLTSQSSGSKKVISSLQDVEWLKKSRVHPMAILVALKVYEQGHGDKGNLNWNPVRGIIDALDGAFYASFKNVEPTGKNHLLALDVSGSMSSAVSGASSLDCRTASAAMALITANVEPNYEIIGFTSGSGRSTRSGILDGLIPLAISPRQRLDDVVKYIAGLEFGGTDCSLPFIYAEENKLDIEAFFVYTDSETWAGSIHPKQALDKYRKFTNKPVRSVVVGMNSNGFTIADPNDAGMMDVVGFDTNAPAIMADFIRD